MKVEELTHRRHEAEAVDEFSEGVAFLLANTVGDDVGLAGKPARGGPPRSIP
jgi:hypothetical protein